MLILLTLLLLDLPLYEMDEVVVTASRYPLLLQNVAVAVMTVERNEILQLNALGLEEVLNAAAGIEFKSYGTPGGVTSIATRGIPSNGTLVLVNEQPLNALTNGMADLSVIDINTIERIEIVKGPVSSIYGANALGGVVNIITAGDAERAEAELGFTPATTAVDNPFRATDTHIRLGLPVGSTAFHLAAAYAHDDGTRSNSELAKHHVNGAVTHKAGRLTLRSSLFYDQKDYGIPGPLPPIDSINSFPRFGDSTATSLLDRQKDYTLMGNITLDLHLADNIDYRACITARRQRTEFHTVYAGLLADTIIEDYDYIVHKLGINTMISSSQNRLNYTLGLDVYYDTLHTKVSSTPSNDATWQASQYEIGTWGELRIYINDNFSINSSIRYDHNSQFGDFLSPTVGLVSVIAPRLWLKISTGKTFRAPTFNDLYWPQSGNPALQPEYGWAYEIRVETSPWSTIFGAFSIFMRNIDDRIAWIPGSNDLWQPQNLNYLGVRGVDLEIEQQLSDLVSYSVNATYLTARQKNEEIVYSYYDWVNDTSLIILEEIERVAAFTPEFTLSSKVDLSLASGFTLNIAGQYASERFNYYPNYADYPNVAMETKELSSHIVINTALTKKIHRFLTIAAGIKNLTNTDYALQFGNSMDDRDYPMPRRTYFARFSFLLR